MDKYDPWLEVTLEDLIDLFEEEAEQVCHSQREAQILATVALRNFINTYGKNVVID